MGSTSTSSTTNALLSFPARLHGPLLEVLQKRSEEKKKKGSKNSDASKIENDGLVCSLEGGSGDGGGGGGGGATATRVLARRDLSRDKDLFVFEPLACETRSGLARAAVEDERARSVMCSVVAEAAAVASPPAPFPSDGSGGGGEASDPLLNSLWGWLLPAGVGIDSASGGGSGRPDARWALPPREIAWTQHSGEGKGPNARVSLLTLDDSDDDDDDDEEENERGAVDKKKEEKEENKLLLVLWFEENVSRGEAVTLDWSFEVESPGFRGSLRRAASLVARLGQGRWNEGPEVRERLSAAVAAAASEGAPAGAGGREERRRQQQARQAASRAALPSCHRLPPPPPPTDGDGGEERGGDCFLIWTDYPVFSEWLDALEGGEQEGEERELSSSLGFLPKKRWRLRRTRDRAAADLVLSRLPLPRSFFEGEDQKQGQLCNQFPFEGALVRKDMLPSTARSALSCCGSESGSSASGSVIGGESETFDDDDRVVFWPRSSDGLHPPWFPPTFDLSTELHFLLRAIEKEEKPSPWIIKPAQASRSISLAVSSAPATLAAFAMRSTAGGDRVAQRYVERPLLTQNGKKFDLRLYVVVRSFGGGGGDEEEEKKKGSSSLALRASLYSRFHAREAPRRYAAPGDHSKGLISQAVFGTVACYNEGGGEIEEDDEEEGGGERDPFLRRAAVDEMLLSSGYDPKAVTAAVASLARAVIEAGAGVIGGPWPRSRAVYGLDVVLDEAEKTRVEMEVEAERKGGEEEAASKASSSRELFSVPTPRLLEVNFAPDLGVAARFNPDLPGLLLREMLREDGDGEGEGEEKGDNEGMFLRLF